MDSLPTAPMLMSREIKVLHLEPTDVCQAACPLCKREIDTNFNKKQQNHLSIKQIAVHVDDDAILNLHKMFMCGNYGDPAAGRYTLDIYRYFRRINPEITLGMNTNGAIQNTAWWQTLGEIFHRQRDYVVFSIDGLEDTNHIYRRGVDWNKLMENARSYVSTGASAHWDMLVYQHNEHQVDACEQLARDMGFTWFRAKISKRPLYPGLEYPLAWNPPIVHDKEINCLALEEKSMYIDAQGRQSPCCFLGGRQHNFIHDLKEVMSSWTTDDPDPTCLSACGQEKDQTNFRAQWRREVELCEIIVSDQ
jgi:MoaA/NifB/PqqE/SkfB family radical SAM enzyme